MCPITDYVKRRAHHHAGRTPQPNKALAAFIAATLLNGGAFGIHTATAATVGTGVPRASIKAAQIILQSGDDNRVRDVLAGRQALLAAAKQVRGRAKLIESFKAASVEDRAAFGRAVGVATIFDAAITPSL